MRRVLLLALLLVALAVAFVGCSKKSTAPVVAGGGGGSTDGAVILTTQPEARAVSAPYDGEIWAQFDRPLDNRTVTTQTVFFKLDGQRQPCTVSYDGITRRVFVRPTNTLALQRTYTVEFSTALHGVDGAPIAANQYFQFTTNSLRRITYDFPLDADLEGRVATLGWAGTLGAQSNILYEVYAGEDSNAVQLRTAPMLQRSVLTRYLPPVVWRPGSRVFWAITAENATTHERENGPLRVFQVMDNSVPIDSVEIRPLDHGSGFITNRNTQFCTSTTLPSGPSFNGAVHWNFTGLPADARLVDATVRLNLLNQDAKKWTVARPTLWLTQNDWNACAVTAPGPPFQEQSGLLSGSFPADSTFATDSTLMVFQADRLAAGLEALARRRSFVTGTVVRSTVNISMHSPTSNDQTRIPRAVLRYQRRPAPVAAR